MTIIHESVFNPCRTGAGLTILCASRSSIYPFEVTEQDAGIAYYFDLSVNTWESSPCSLLPRDELPLG